MYTQQTCTRTHTATLLKIAQTWQQPRCPSAGEWVNKQFYSHTVERCPATRSREPTARAATWLTLTCVSRGRERSQMYGLRVL